MAGAVHSLFLRSENGFACTVTFLSCGSVLSLQTVYRECFRGNGAMVVMITLAMVAGGDVGASAGQDGPVAGAGTCSI